MKVPQQQQTKKNKPPKGGAGGPMNSPGIGGGGQAPAPAMANNSKEGSVKTVQLSSKLYGQIVSVLAKAKRPDLIKVMADDLSDVTINKDSVKILEEKAAKILEDLHKAVEKLADGDVEADLLLKHVVKKLASHTDEGGEEEPGEEATPEHEASETPEEEEAEEAAGIQGRR